jgi:kynurenine formamidase
MTVGSSHAQSAHPPPTADGPALLAEALARCRVIDLSPVIRSHMPMWPPHPDMLIIADARTHEQHGYFCQTLLMPEHTGSHVDAPAHIHPHLMDRTIDTYPADHLIRPGKKVSAVSLDLEPGQLLTLGDFQRLSTEQGVTVHSDDVVLVEFGWDSRADDDGTADVRNWWGKNEPGFAEDLCAWLADRRVRAVGTDTAACDVAVRDGKILSAYGHRQYFLPNDILIIEGLRRLSEVPPEFHFIALPLRLDGGSGSPLRAIAVVADAPGDI